MEVDWLRWEAEQDAEEEKDEGFADGLKELDEDNFERWVQKHPNAFVFFRERACREDSSCKALNLPEP